MNPGYEISYFTFAFHPIFLIFCDGQNMFLTLLACDIMVENKKEQF